MCSLSIEAELIAHHVNSTACISHSLTFCVDLTFQLEARALSEAFLAISFASHARPESLLVSYLAVVFSESAHMKSRRVLDETCKEAKSIEEWERRRINHFPRSPRVRLSSKPRDIP